MNEIINWIAVNNTLMIRIGFTAILVLLMVYIFRFFFMPRVSIVAEATEVKSKVSKSNGSKSVKAEEQSIEDIIENSIADDPEAVEAAVTATAEAKAASAVTETISTSASVEVVAAVDSEQNKMQLEEIQKLKEENANIKAEASAAQTKISQLEKNLTTAKADATAAALATAAPISGAPAADADVVNGLNKKIEQLESRLSEYEIIAEEISEIGELKKENESLKKQLEGSGTPQAPAAVEVESSVALATETPAIEAAPATAEPDASVVGLEDSIGSALDDFLTSQNDEGVTAEPAAAAAKTEPTATADISPEEKELLEQFEETAKKKEST